MYDNSASTIHYIKVLHSVCKSTREVTYTLTPGMSEQNIFKNDNVTLQLVTRIVRIGLRRYEEWKLQRQSCI